jgi:hypothetical protein
MQEAAAFLACMKDEFPAQYAMTFLASRPGFDLPPCVRYAEPVTRPTSSGTRA